ncbi:LysR substrate-binding domain-containing protein [Gluconacetobacter sacchari]|uniref:LysR family transcriptional regulator n=2 Tax=Gluconacetobacter sacchari TaxID=92759 RepID=A0A7W4NQ55_9PROT|nr:LysR family transcriptional regulator [Gluconacetobacter sacchari]MBB2159643.1 LysR family transcriptional regulator [Gluconacetobacter sacchari]GBQ20695.1 transcriptional regulator [Gluconacetobacter sacchari DSM 12717]
MITARQIEAFHAVVSVGSMTGAARHLGRTQSAISRLILDLEEVVGFELFHRAGARLQPTENAMLLHEEVRRSYVGLRNIESRARQLASGDTRRRIAVGATPALSGGLLPEVVAGCGPLGADMPASLTSMASENVVSAVAEGTLDIGLATLPIDIANVRVHWIGEAPCVAVLSENDPLATQDVLSLKQLHNRHVMTVGNPFRLRRSIDAALKADAVSPHTKLETNTSLIAIMAARAGLGVAIVEPVTAYGIPLRGTVVRPLAEQIPSVWGVLTPEFRPPHPEVEHLIERVGTMAYDLLPGFVRHPPEALDRLQTRLFKTEPGPDARA